MDAFYAAVEAQRNPALRDRPLGVGADPREGHGRGVVTAASYAARRYGIRSALPISRAWRLAEAARRRGEPETIFVRNDHAVYREVAAGIMALLAAAGDAFQRTGADEAYLELSWLGGFDAAVERARRLKAEIVSQEGLTASVGIGPNKLVAKIASDFQKPDGLTVVRPEEVQPFLDPLRIRVIPGIGPKTEHFLHERHIRTDQIERARRLKAEIVSQEGLTASVGIGPNKLVAKIASDFQKPDGLTVVRPEEVQPFLDPLRIRVIPGIGPKTEHFLHERHIRTD